MIYTAPAVVWYTWVQVYTEAHENIFFIQATCLAYHHALACISSALGCIHFSNDDIQRRTVDDMQFLNIL